MNELERLRRVYAAIDEPSQESVARARGLLLAEIASSDLANSAGNGCPVLEPSHGRGVSRRGRRWGLVAIAAAILVGGLLVTPAFGIGSRLLDLIRGDAPRTPEVSTPVWSPDGRRIAVKGWSGSDGNYDIYVMNADGSGLRNLTRDLTTVHGGWSGEGGPVWSPDGGKLLFGRDPGFNVGEILVVNADGSGRRRLTSGRGPAWSPNGRLIAYGSAGLYVMNADGSGQRRLARNADGPVWSPDGRKIAFRRFRNGHPEVFVMNAGGGAQRRLATSATDPVWSPDGELIAYSSARDGSVESSSSRWLYVMNADGSGKRRLAHHRGLRQLAWSPDGRKIVVVSRRHGNAEIYVVDADGSGERNLTGNPAHDADPAWSPDGRRLLFVSDRDRGIYAVYVMNADGSGQRSVTHG